MGVREALNEDARIQLMLDRMREHWVSDGESIQSERDAFAALSRHFPEPEGVDEQWQSFRDAPSFVTQPRNHQMGEGPVVLYLHGGAFLIGSAQIYRHQSAQIARLATATVVTVDYRLAPEHPFPAALDDAVGAYLGVIYRGIDHERVVIAGDSAGGNLALATAMRLRDEWSPLPAGLVLISPWVDLTCAGESMETNADPRHLAQRQGLLSSASVYLDGEDPLQPSASPLFGNLEGLPPALIQVGALETLLDDSVKLEGELASAANDVRLEVYDGMVHEWHLLSALLEPDQPLPSARRALGAIGEFVSEVTGR